MLSRHFSRSRVLALFLSVGLAACARQADVQDYLDSAQAHWLAGNYAAAEIELKNVLRQDIHHPRARWMLGMVHFQAGDYASAEKELDRALSLEWPADAVVPPLARALFAQGKYFELEALPRAQLSDEASARVLVVRSLAALQQEDVERAAQLLDQAELAWPGLLEARLARARLEAAGGDRRGALDAVEALAREAPDDPAVWQLLGDLRAADDAQGALQAYDSAIELRDSDYASVLKRALLRLQAGDYPAAQADARRLLQLSPRGPAGHYVMGVVHYQGRRHDKAIAALNRAVSAADEYPQILFLLGSANLLEGHLEQARTFAERFYATVPGNVGGRKLLALVRARSADYAGVAPLLEPVVAAYPDDVEALNILASALMRSGQVSAGLAYLLRVAELRPEAPEAQLRLGAGYLLGGRQQEAGQAIDIALALQPDSRQAQILRVFGYLRQGDVEAALAAAQDMHEQAPNSTAALLLLGRVSQEAGRDAAAEQAYLEAVRIDPAHVGANLNLAHIALARGDAEQARARYQAILQADASQVSALLGLARLEQETGHPEGMRAALERALRAHPDDPRPRLLLGRHYLASGRPEQAVALFSADSDLDWGPEALLLLAQAQIASGEAVAARGSLERLSRLVPDNAQLHHLRAITQAADAPRMRAELERALSLDPQYLPSRIALTRLALLEGREEDFAAGLARLQAQAPDNTEVLLLRAAAASRAGDLRRALELAAQAHAGAPATATVQALGALHTAAGDVPAALALYREWLAAHPQDAGVRMALAAALQRAEPAAAAAEYRRVLEQDPENVSARNNLAWLLRESDPAGALRHARQAAAQAPDSATVLDTLAMVEYSNKQLPQARRTIARAVALDPAATATRYHQALIMAARGDARSARAVLDKLLRGGADFPQAEAARALRDSLSP